MKQNGLSTLEIYINKVFKLLIVMIPSIALCAGTTFTVLHLLGFYPSVKTSAMLLFDCSCVIYTFIGIAFNRRCTGEDGQIKAHVLKKGKAFIALLEVIQWNFITYMIPSRDFWAYSFFFVLLSAFFLDRKFVLLITVEIVASMFVSWLIRPEFLLPVQDELYIPEMALRGVLLILSFLTIWLLTATIEKYLAKELEKISDYDTLTLLYNRRRLESYVEDAIARSKGNGRFSVIMADLDDFKKVNDTYGHGCGDEVLRNVAGIVRNATEGKGIVFRYGGEEILILVYADGQKTAALAEEIRKRVEAYPTYYENHTVNITLTLGVAEYHDTDTFETLTKRADAKLYDGKSHGKNCVIQ